MTAMDLLRAAPDADIVLAAVAGEPGVYVVGGAVRDALLGRVPRELDLVVEGDALAVARARGGARRRHADRPRALRDGDDQRRRASPSTSPAPAASATRGPGALPDGRAGRDARGGPRAPRLHRQRDRRQPRRRRDHGVAGRAGGPRRGRAARPARALVHRRPDADAAARPLRRAAGLRARSGHRGADRPGAVRDRHRRPPRQRAAAAAQRAARRAWRCSSATASARALLGEGFRVDLAGRARPAPAPLALAACCTAIPREALAARLDQLGFRGRTATSWWPRRAASSAFTDPWTAATADLWRLLRRERVETVQLLAAAGDPARGAGSTTSATAGSRSPATT